MSRTTLAPSLMRAMRADVAGAAVAIHDPSRLEWSITLPFSSTNTQKYTVEAELEIPTRLYVEHRPWSRMQALARFDWPVAGPQSKLAEVDVLRREVLDVDGKLVRAAEGFRQHALAMARGEIAPDEIQYSPLSLWLEMGLTAISDSRKRIVASRDERDQLLARERVLADEFLSVRALAMFTAMTRHVEQFASDSEHDTEVSSQLRHAYDDELAYRQARQFCTVDARSPNSLETYVTRANALKKHFESLLYLQRETRHVDARFQPWIAALSALIAGAGVFLVQLFALKPGDRSAGFRWGVVLLAIAFGVLYAGRDRMKAVTERLLSKGLRRFTAERVTKLLSPLEGNHVVARAKESIEERGLAKPDALNPDLGIADQATLLRFVHNGELHAPSTTTNIRPRALRLIFRYDFSWLFARLDDPKKSIAVPDPASDRLQLVRAPRTYRIALRLRLRAGATSEDQHYDLVLNKKGLVRLEPRSETTTRSS